MDPPTSLSLTALLMSHKNATSESHCGVDGRCFIKDVTIAPSGRGKGFTSSYDPGPGAFSLARRRASAHGLPWTSL